MVHIFDLEYIARSCVRRHSNIQRDQIGGGLWGTTCIVQPHCMIILNQSVHRRGSFELCCASGVYFDTELDRGQVDRFFKTHMNGDLMIKFLRSILWDLDLFDHNMEIAFFGHGRPCCRKSVRSVFRMIITIVFSDHPFDTRVIPSCKCIAVSCWDRERAERLSVCDRFGGLGTCTAIRIK